VSQFLTELLLATALMLALCFGVAAWRLSEGKESEISGRMHYPRVWQAPIPTY
jgi:hypothetical protein